MRILWLPHLHWEFIRGGQREYRLAEGIKDVHEVHFATWVYARRPGPALQALRSKTWSESGFTIHQFPRIPNIAGARVHEKSARGLRINEMFQQRALRQIVRRDRIDLVICSISHQAVGLPPADLGVPVIFDYLDYKLEAWPDVERSYFRLADAVTCTSQVLVENTERLHPHVYALPNGVDLDAASTADGHRVRVRYGLDGAKIVSLIGVTASPRLFYIDAIADLARRFDNVVFLMVGYPGPLGDAMIGRARQLGLRAIATGQVPPNQVADFFAATDVGLYPGDQTSYFDAASPLKVLEYSAAGKPVVATDLAELRNWGFPNVHLAAPTPESFSRALTSALTARHGSPDLSRFSWPTLTARLLEILQEVSERSMASRPRREPQRCVR
jgi:glycosyltransferase involved in cell wall biosynthesis